MISSVFGKTKPINYIILLVVLFFFYWGVNLFLFEKSFTPEELIIQILVLGVLLFSIFIVNFIVKRNQISGTNSFCILYFTLLIILFPEVLVDNNAILCSFFLLLAMRKLISMKSLKNLKLKLFDASIWILVSSLFYDWALLFLFLVFISIYFYEPKNIKNWLVPVIAVFGSFLITFCVLILLNNTSYLENHYQFELGISDHLLDLWTHSSKLVIYAIVVIITGFFSFVKIGKLGLGRIITMRLVAIALGLGLVISFIKTSNTVFPVLITFFPGAVLLSRYAEMIKKSNVKEVVLIVSVAAPFLVLVAEYIIK